MIIVCDEETCAWRTRTWAFMVLWLFTASMMGIYIVHLQHLLGSEQRLKLEYKKAFYGLTEQIHKAHAEVFGQ